MSTRKNTRRMALESAALRLLAVAVNRHIRRGHDERGELKRRMEDCGLSFDKLGRFRFSPLALRGNAA